MIDQVYILSLDKRKDLWLALADECRERNFNVKPFIVGDGSDPALVYDHIDIPGVPQEWKWGDGISAQRHYWAFVSHKKIIRDAIKNGYKNILMLEDDVYYTSRFDRHWRELSDHIKCLDFDCCYLGYHAFEYENHLFSGRNLQVEEKYKKNGQIELLSIPQCGGLFAVILNKRTFPLIMSMPAIAPIDHQLNIYNHLLNRIHVSPPIMYVRSGFSHCENTYIPRDNL